MKRTAVVLVSLYFGAAVARLVKERAGELTCECRQDCWCKRPGLNLFRWVFPVGHSL